MLQIGSNNDTAVVLPETNSVISYSSLRSQVESVARALAGMGIHSGARIAMALPNGLPAIVCFLGASWAATAAPLNPAYREEELRFYLEDTSASVLLVPSEGGMEARSAAAGRIPIITVDVDSQGEVQLSGQSSRKAMPLLSPDSTALVLHTSGSTGPPKRVPIKHRNLTASIANIVATYQLGPSDISLCVMPLFHVHGLVASTLATLASGGTIILPPKFNPLAFWRQVQEHRVTWFSAVPTLHQLLLARLHPGEPRPEGARHLRFIRSCSSALSPETFHNMQDAFCVPILEAYGMTEATHQMASNPLPPGICKPGSVGKGTGVSISIMDQAGNHLPSGQTGEVVIQGPTVIDGYENNPTANESSFTQGWFRTGDQGFLDSDNYLSLTGRIKELINRGGEKIAPREIDEALLAHPAVAQAVCFGVPHITWGEEVAAAVVLHKKTATEADLLAHCRNRLADFKCPKQIHIVSSLPCTASGKIQRRAIAAFIAGEKVI